MANRTGTAGYTRGVKSVVALSLAPWLLAACLDDPGSGGRNDAAPPSDAGIDAPVDDVDAGPCDGDGDGYLAAECESALPADCNDDVAEIHPGAFDDAGDDVDEDCLDGALKEAGIVPTLVAEDAETLSVQNGHVLVTFARAANYRPSEMFASAGGAPTTNLLYDEAVNPERLAGANAFSEWFGWDAIGEPGISHIALGRAVVRFRIAWVGGDGNGTGATKDCGWCGDTYVTVLPDGRIHTDEDLRLESGAPGFATAYVALHHDAVSHVTWSNNDADPIAIVDQTPQELYRGGGDPAAWTCAFDAAAAHVVGWSFAVPAGQSSAGPRIFQSFGSTPQVALQFDWVAGGGAPLGDYLGNFLTVVRQAPSPSPCEPVDALALPVLNPPVLDVEAPGARGTGQIGDDDADGFSEGGGFYSIVASDEAVVSSVAFTINTVGAADPASMMVYVEQMDFSRDPVVFLDGVRLSHGRDYLFQAEGEGSIGWVFLGEDLALGNGARIEIRTP